MAINFPEGTQNLPAYATHCVYAQSNQVQIQSIGNYTTELANYQLNNIEIRNSTDVIHLQCRIYNYPSDYGDEFGYGWQYRTTGGWAIIDQNNTRGVTNGSRSGACHATHEHSPGHGEPADIWGVMWKPGFSSTTTDVRPCIIGHGNTGGSIYINAFVAGYSDGGTWNIRSSSYAMATVYTTDGVN